MPRILVMSDLHTESSPFDMPLPKDPDLVLLAGDIGYGAAGITFGRIYFTSTTPVAVICGNHEFFRGDIRDVIHLCREEAAKTTNVRFLENDEVIFDVAGTRIRVIGCVLWTDFLVLGTQERSFDAARAKLPDYRFIDNSICRNLTPEAAATLHEVSRDWLRSRLESPFEGKTIVMTHHAPSLRSQHPKFIGDELTPVFISDLEGIIAEFRPALWVHGHTHWSVDYQLGQTRVYSNQLGFPGQDAGFRLELIDL